jgi:cAMP-dependent protein kinase regulator
LHKYNFELKGDLKVVSIDRDSFKRLLGPLDEILKRNFSRYEKYMA